jgi:hypothetical protein
MAIKYKYEEIKNKIYDLGYELISKEYNGFSDKLILKDKDGFLYISTITKIFNKHGLKKFHTSNPNTINNIRLWLKLNKKPFVLISENYINMNDKLEWKCLKDDCQEIFKNNFLDILFGGNNCPFCSGFQVGVSNCLATKRPDLAKEWHQTKNGDLTPYNVTCWSSKKVWWQCENAHEYQMIIADKMLKLKCAYCNNLLASNPELCKEWNYDKNKSNPKDYAPHTIMKVWWKCKDCSFEWKTSISHRNATKIIDRRNCPKCSESKGECKINKYLIDKKFNFEREFKFDDCKYKRHLPFDFVVFDDLNKIKFIIEYDGILHFQDKYKKPKEFEIHQRRDLIKTNYCITNNIPLLRIPYWDFDKIEEILTDYISKIK